MNSISLYITRAICIVIHQQTENPSQHYYNSEKEACLKNLDGQETFFEKMSLPYHGNNDDFSHFLIGFIFNIVES